MHPIAQGRNNAEDSCAGRLNFSITVEPAQQDTKRDLRILKDGTPKSESFLMKHTNVNTAVHGAARPPDDKPQRLLLTEAFSRAPHL